MSFNLSRFKGEFERLGGPLRSSLFEVNIFNYPSNGSRMTSDNLRFFCKTANIPGIEIQTSSYLSVASLPREFPIGYQKAGFNAIFLLDSDHQVLSFFHQWMQHVVNFSTKGGDFSEDKGRLPYEFGYKENYGARMIVRHYSTEGNTDKFYEVILDGAFPTSIGSVDLSWENNNSFLTLPVNFGYDRIEYSGERAGSPTSSLGRGNGLFEILGAVGGFAGVVQQTVRQGTSNITTVQDAVNRVTRVGSSFNNLINKL